MLEQAREIDRQRRPPKVHRLPRKEGAAARAPAQSADAAEADEGGEGAASAGPAKKRRRRRRPSGSKPAATPSAE